MSSLPQSNNLQEIQRAFLERDAELRRLVGDTKTAAAASVTGLRKTISSSRGTSGSTTPSGGTTSTTVKGRRVITAVSTEALSFYETNYTQAEFTESADIISIETNHPAWVRVYSSAAARLEDASRLFADPPVAGTGLMVEVLTYEPDDLLIYLSPVPFWNNCDTVLGKTAYIAVTRWDNGDPENLEMTFTILPQEEMDKNGSQGLPGPRGFTGAGYRTRGEWSGTETYLENDVVSRNGSVYCSLVNDNLNQDPETATTCWTLWASKGGKGDKGDKGDNGTAATITVGTVTSGSSPSVSNSGTSTAAVLDFVLQKGDKGDPGEGGGEAYTGTATLAVGGMLTITHSADTTGRRLVAGTTPVSRLLSIAGTAFSPAYFSTRPPSMAFDGHAAGTDDSGWVNNGGSTGILGYQRSSGVRVEKYLVSAFTLNGSTERTPSAWTMEGSADGGETYTVLDTQTAQSGWGTSETREYTISSPGVYTHYRLNITSNNGDPYTGVGQLQLLTSALPTFINLGGGIVVTYGDPGGADTTTKTTFENATSAAVDLSAVVWV